MHVDAWTNLLGTTIVTLYALILIWRIRLQMLSCPFVSFTLIWPPTRPGTPPASPPHDVTILSDLPITSSELTPHRSSALVGADLLTFCNCRGHHRKLDEYISARRREGPDLLRRRRYDPCQASGRYGTKPDIELLARLVAHGGRSNLEFHVHKQVMPIFESQSHATPSALRRMHGAAVIARSHGDVGSPSRPSLTLPKEPS